MNYTPGWVFLADKHWHNELINLPIFTANGIVLPPGKYYLVHTLLNQLCRFKKYKCVYDMSTIQAPVLNISGAWIWSSLYPQMSWHLTVLRHQQAQCWLTGCHLDNFRCNTWRKFHQNDISVSVTVLDHEHMSSQWLLRRSCASAFHRAISYFAVHTSLKFIGRVSGPTLHGVLKWRVSTSLS